MPKQLVHEIEGLKIYVSLKKAKRSGKDRIWVSVRQEKPKHWKVAANLSYVNAFDVRFER